MPGGPGPEPGGERWYYRELWPSTVRFRWDSGSLLGRPGPGRQDEKGPRIRDCVQTMQWLEDNPENCLDGKPFQEDFFERVIDYAGPRLR